MNAPLLQPLLGDWPSAALSCLEREPCVVRVIVASVRGSAPREPGACMLVDSHAVTGTIGGGNLEREAIEAARAQMEECASVAAVRIYRLTLASDLAQCCGGVVEIWVERLTRADHSWLAAAAALARTGRAVLTTRVAAVVVQPAAHLAAAAVQSGAHLAAAVVQPGAHQLPARAEGTPERICVALGEREHFDRVHFDIEEGVSTLRERVDAPAVPLWLYGAGHVGRAVVRGLAELPFDVTWIDSRAALLNGPLPANARIRHTEDLAALARNAPPSAYHLIMTHDHGIDFDVCHAILQRGEFAWLGLIGSASKAAKFRSRLARAGISREHIARLVCPIGVGGLTSKLPAAIAAGVTVQLLQELEHVAERALFQSSEPAVHDECPAENCKSCRARQGVYR